MTGATEPLLDVALSDLEREVLLGALIVWGGPAHPSDSLSRAMGWLDAKDFEVDGTRLSLQLRKMCALTSLDWGRALVSAEFAITSSVYGAAGDWEVLTGIDRLEAFETLRLLQTKLTRLSRDAIRDYQHEQAFSTK